MKLEMAKLENLPVGTKFRFGWANNDKNYSGIHTILGFKASGLKVVCVCSVLDGIFDMVEYDCDSITFDVSIISTPLPQPPQEQ